MTRKRRSFTSEFKQEAASLVLDQGYSVPQASTSLGVERARCGAGLSSLRLNAKVLPPKARLLPLNSAGYRSLRLGVNAWNGRRTF